MSLITPNRLLVAALLLGLGTAYLTFPALLQQVKDAAKAPAPDPPPPAKNLQKDSENALKIETLRTLTDGYSYDLRNSAIKIVASRTARSSARDLLLRDLASRNHNRREDAISAMKLIFTNNALSSSVINEFRNSKAITAVVKALINVLRERRQKVILDELKNPPPLDDDEIQRKLPPSPIRPAYRPPQELGLMFLLSNILNSHSRRSLQYAPIMNAALEAGLVTKWLANYPFPCTLPENSRFNYKRSDVVRLFDRLAWMSDDSHMADIINHSIMQYPLGRKQMRQVGLGASSLRENVHVDLGHRHPWNDWEPWRDDRTDAGSSGDESDHTDVRMTNGETTAGLLPLPESMPFWEEPAGPPTTRAGARLRSAERSQEEDRLRRRHREAVVLAEPGAPLTRDNIIQRADSRILPEPMNGIIIDIGSGGSDGPTGYSFTNTSSSSSTHAEPVAIPQLDGAELPDEFAVPEADAVLDLDAEAEVEQEMRALAAQVQAEEEEFDRAQRRHRELEHLINEDPEIQGTTASEPADVSSEHARSSSDTAGLGIPDPDA